jgi:hypothetical protein
VNTVSRTVFRALAAISVVVVFAVCALRTYASYVEYYGEGPPYYGRTTNMDKWQSPVFGLVIMNVLGLAWVIYGARRVAKSR